MKNGFKTLITLLIVALVITAIFLARQITITRSISIEKSEQPLIETAAINIPTDASDPIFGNQGAPITITEFVDINSRESREAHIKLVKFIEAHPTELRLIYKDFPSVSFFSSANLRPHYASYCALKQDKNKFWNYLFELTTLNRGQEKNSVMESTAEKAGLNMTAWKSCLDSAETKMRMEMAITVAESLGLNKAPAIYVNNRKVNYLSEIDLNEFLNELVKKY